MITLKQLQQQAKELGLKGYSRMKKADLQAMVQLELDHQDKRNHIRQSELEFTAFELTHDLANTRTDACDITCDVLSGQSCDITQYKPQTVDAAATDEDTLADVLTTVLITIIAVYWVKLAKPCWVAGVKLWGWVRPLVTRGMHWLYIKLSTPHYYNPVSFLFDIPKHINQTIADCN